MNSTNSIGVIGDGTMGTGIAQICGVAGFPVVVLDVDAARAARGRDAVAGALDRLRELKDPPYRPAPLLVEMVAAGHLGRKSGRGFYTYG